MNSTLPIYSALELAQDEFYNKESAMFCISECEKVDATQVPSVPAKAKAPGLGCLYGVKWKTAYDA